MQKLKVLILSSEDILIAKLLGYAKERNYIKYTATLQEAWRLSIICLSGTLIQAMDASSEIPELGPDDDYSNDIMARFGIVEAQKHRSRGASLAMFASFSKYYEQIYEDLINETDLQPDEIKYYSLYIKRCFDHIQMGYTIEWAGKNESDKLDELKESNRELASEKNKYYTVFESIFDPIILIDEDSYIEDINDKAAEIFLNGAPPDYDNNLKGLDWIKTELVNLINLNKNEVSLEKTIPTVNGLRTFIVKFQIIRDIQATFKGSVVIFNDITERIVIERELKNQHEKLQAYAFTDPMTGVSNRRTGLILLEKELLNVTKKDGIFSVCFIDIDCLKHVNDNYGHNEGDALINKIVSLVSSSLREEDILSRMGGDEFLLILPALSKQEAENSLKQICENVAEYNLKALKPYTHSFSYGIVEVTKDSKENADEIISIADKRMYQDKTQKKAAIKHKA